MGSFTERGSNLMVSGRTLPEGRLKEEETRMLSSTSGEVGLSDRGWGLRCSRDGKKGEESERGLVISVY